MPDLRKQHEKAKTDKLAQLEDELQLAMQTAVQRSQVHS